MGKLSVRREALPVERMGEYEGRTAELGDYTVAFENTLVSRTGET